MWCLVMDDGTRVPITELDYSGLEQLFLLMQDDDQPEAKWLHPNWQTLESGEWVNLDHVSRIVWEEEEEEGNESC